MAEIKRVAGRFDVEDTGRHYILEIIPYEDGRIGIRRTPAGIDSEPDTDLIVDPFGNVTTYGRSVTPEEIERLYVLIAEIQNRP